MKSHRYVPPPKKPQLIIKAPKGNAAHKSPRYGKVPIISSQISQAPTEQSITPNLQPKSDELFVDPVKPSFIFLNFASYLTETEESEILQYRSIYYLRQQPPKNRRDKNMAVPKYFNFVLNDHIAYRYQQLQVLGKGSFGSVIKCLDHKTNQLVAVKLMYDKPKDHSQILFELNILKRFQNDEDQHHIIKLIEHFQFRSFFCISMELMGPDVYNVLRMQRYKGYNIGTIQIIARQISDALAYMHSHNIIHCDIKPENILFEDNSKRNSRLIDFGCSCFIGNIMFSYIQSRYYRAPEVVFGVEYGPEIDIWSLGCVICEMYTGVPLFPAEDETELMQMIAEVLGLPTLEQIQQGPRSRHYFDQSGQMLRQPNSSGKLRLPGTSSIAAKTEINDPELLDLIKKCLQWKPEDRIKADKIQEHPWLQKRLKSPRNIVSSGNN